MSDTEDMAGLAEYHAGIRDRLAYEITRAQSFSAGKALIAHRDKHARWCGVLERLGAERTCKDSLQVDTPPDPV